MAGGWWYLWTDGGVGGWGLVARACWWERVRCLWRPCVLCQCCALSRSRSIRLITTKQIKLLPAEHLFITI